MTAESQMIFDGVNDVAAWVAFSGILLSFFVVVLVPVLAAAIGAYRMFRWMRGTTWNNIVARVARRTLFALLLAAPFACGQGTNQGAETIISYSGTNATLVPPSTPATNFNAVSGTTTFILPVANPAVAVRLYLTNDTANQCSGFTVQMFSSTDAQTNTFNGALQNWQTVLLQNPTGGLTSIVSLTLPGNGSAYITSAAIQAPKVALQIINTQGSACSTTTLEATAVIASISLSSPLVSALSNSPGSAQGVQGIQPQGYNSNSINPVQIGGQGLPTNTSFLNDGLDSFSVAGFALNTGTLNAPLGTTPPVTQNSSAPLAIAFDSETGSPGGGCVNLPWAILSGLTCAGGGNVGVFAYQPAVASTPFYHQYIGSLGIPINLQSVLMTFKQGTARQARQGGTSAGFISATLAGSALLIAVNCNTTATCTNTISDTLGLTYVLVTSTTFSSSVGSSTLSVYMNTTFSGSGGSDTISATSVSGTITSVGILEISNPTVSSLNAPSITLQADTVGGLVTHADAQAPNQWVCTVTLSTNTTTLCEVAPVTVAGIPVRSYVTDIQVQTTTAGTATAIQLVTGTGSNCGTGTANLSAITYPNTAIGTVNLFPFRTPLIAPIQTEVCAKQAGTTAGTSVVEIHGFFAP